MKPLMLDLFAGLGGASAAFAARGWEVVTVDNDPAFGCTHTADLTAWSWDGRCRTGIVPSLALVESAVRIIRECEPDWWVIENVKGAVKYLTPILGEPKQSHGPFFLWGQFPPFRCRVRPFKERLSSARKAERAKVPGPLSAALAEAIESNLLT